MALPASVPTGTVTGTWYTPSGALAVGTIVFLLLESVEVPDDPDGVVIPVRTVVDVPAGVLNQTLPEGMYQVSMRLSELYRVTKVVEITEGTALNLPDAVGMLLPDPDLYDPVRSVNGVFPDAYGNIEVSGGGSGAVASVFGRTGVVVAVNGDYTKSQVGLSNVDNTSDLGKPISTATQTALDGKAATNHTHTISNVTGLQTALDSKQASGDYATVGQLNTGLATKAATVHTHTIADVIALQASLDAKQVKIRQHIRYNTDATPDLWYPVTDTGGVWTVFTAPSELTVTATVGDRIKANWSFLGRSIGDWFMDLAVVTGASVIKRYLSSGTLTPNSVGSPTNYPIPGAEFQGVTGFGGFTVTADDLDSGSIRVATLVKATATGGRLYASTGFPFTWSLENIGPA